MANGEPMNKAVSDAKAALRRICEEFDVEPEDWRPIEALIERLTAPLDSALRSVRSHPLGGEVQPAPDLARLRRRVEARLRVLKRDEGVHVDTLNELRVVLSLIDREQEEGDAK